MKYTIEVDIKETDTIRGYHDRQGTVTFKYEGESHYTVEREQQIVEGITGGPEHSMWHKATNTAPGVWAVRYGYDSGD